MTQESTSFEQPTKGKKVSRAAFEKIRAEKMNEGPTVIKHKL